jgi:hypothetical protein
LQSTASGIYRYIKGSAEGRGRFAEVTLAAEKNLLHTSLNKYPITEQNMLPERSSHKESHPVLDV